VSAGRVGHQQRPGFKHVKLVKQEASRKVTGQDGLPGHRKRRQHALPTHLNRIRSHHRAVNA
jgi:hypothetical protein